MKKIILLLLVSMLLFIPAGASAPITLTDIHDHNDGYVTGYIQNTPNFLTRPTNVFYFDSLYGAYDEFENSSSYLTDGDNTTFSNTTNSGRFIHFNGLSIDPDRIMKTDVEHVYVRVKANYSGDTATNMNIGTYDINGDGIIDATDEVDVWNHRTTEIGYYNSTYDINFDGTVNMQDAGLVHTANGDTVNWTLGTVANDTSWYRLLPPYLDTTLVDMDDINFKFQAGTLASCVKTHCSIAEINLSNVTKTQYKVLRQATGSREYLNFSFTAYFNWTDDVVLKMPLSRYTYSILTVTNVTGGNTINASEPIPGGGLNSMDNDTYYFDETDQYLYIRTGHIHENDAVSWAIVAEVAIPNVHVYTLTDDDTEWWGWNGYPRYIINIEDIESHRKFKVPLNYHVGFIFKRTIALSSVDAWGVKAGDFTRLETRKTSIVSGTYQITSDIYNYDLIIVVPNPGFWNTEFWMELMH